MLINISFAVILISIFVVNFFRTDMSGIYLGDRLGKDILDTVPSDSILLLEADQYLFNTLYYKIAYNYRPDIPMPSAQTGFEEIIDLSPTLSSGINYEEYFIKNKNRIEFDELLAALIIGTQSGKNIYVNQGNTLSRRSKTFMNVPYGLLDKIYLSNQDLPSEEEYLSKIKKIWNSYDLDRFYDKNLVVNENITLSDIRGLYIINLLSTADFIENHFGNKQIAMEYRLKAFSIDPIFMAQQQSKK